MAVLRPPSIVGTSAAVRASARAPQAGERIRARGGGAKRRSANTGALVLLGVRIDIVRILRSPLISVIACIFASGRLHRYHVVAGGTGAFAPVSQWIDGGGFDGLPFSVFVLLNCVSFARD